MKKLTLLTMACFIALFAYAVDRDETVYEPRGENDMFTFENVWLVSHVLENWVPIVTNNAVPPATQWQHSRNMQYRDGKMYFADRYNRGLVVVDAATGEILEPIHFPDESGVFITTQESTSSGGVTVQAGERWGMPFNDLQMDNAGNFVTSNLVLAPGELFHVWVIDPDNPNDPDAHHLVLDVVVSRTVGLEEVSEVRFDYIAVLGDMRGDGYIFTVLGSTFEVFRWTIRGGVADPVVYRIEFDTYTPNTTLSGIQAPNPNCDPENLPEGVTECPVTLVSLGNLSTAAHITPVTPDLFYVSMMQAHPFLMQNEGMFATLVDGFCQVPFYVNDPDYVQRPRHTSPTSLTLFTLRGDHFMIVGSGANAPVGVGLPNSTFNLYKFADGERRFKEMELLWEFPAMGMGVQGNGGRTTAARVSVNDETGIAYIHVWYVDNGYGVYRLRSTREEWTNVPGIQADDAIVSMFVEGNMVMLDQEVAQISVFSVTGQLLTVGINSNAINIPTTGVFLVRATTHDGQIAVERVIIR